MCCVLSKCTTRLKILRTMPTGYQNPISIIISVVLVDYRTLNLADFGGGPKRAEKQNGYLNRSLLVLK